VKPHYTDDLVTLYHGDCLDVLRELPDASVDAVVTDPPYGLEFMGKEWDAPWKSASVGRGARVAEQRSEEMTEAGKAHSTSSGPYLAARVDSVRVAGAPFQAWCELWATECLRVLKPGGHLLAFGGSRTFHRLTCAIEDAGFEIRDSLMWQHMKHVFCQCHAVPYSHEKVSRKGVSDMRGDLDSCDPLPSRQEQDLRADMRCEGCRCGEHGPTQVDQREGSDHVRCVCEADPDLAEQIGANEGPNVLPSMQRETQRGRVGDTRPQGGGSPLAGVDGATVAADDRSEQPGLEGRSDVPQGQGELRRPSVCAVTEVGAPDGAQGRLHHGTPPSDGGVGGAAVDAGGSGQSPEPRPEGQPQGEPGTLAGQRLPQTRRGWPLCDWCAKPLAPPVDLGPLAWNYGSGFPKSLDVSKAIDKAAGAEREVVGRADPSNPRTAMARKMYGTELQDGPGEGVAITTPATPDAERWQGWGTALKPAHEPIVLARKPLIGTVSANVLAHGTGALNVDGCRIAGDVPSVPQPAFSRDLVAGFGASDGRNGEMSSAPAGRWPANVILDDDAAALLDEQSGTLAHNPPARWASDGATSPEWGTIGNREAGQIRSGFGDTGGASRFFYTAKAGSDERPRVDGIAHPTVKPLDLMRWLVRLVTPPGGTVLEPFAGSGTTLEACVIEGFHAIGIEREDDYLKLIEVRLTKPIQPDIFGGIA